MANFTATIANRGFFRKPHFKKTNSKKINPFLKFMVEGFWWGFVAICLKKNIKIHQIKVNHRIRISGNTNVFHLSKIPSIALRNIIGLDLTAFA